MEIYPYFHEYGALYNVIKGELQDIASIWDRVWDELYSNTNVDQIYTDYNLATRNLSLLRSKILENPYDTSLLLEQHEMERIWAKKHRQLVSASVLMGRLIADGETIRNSYWRYMHVLEKSMERLQKAIQLAEQREKQIPFKPLKIPRRDYVITMINKNKDDLSACDNLVGREETCHHMKPDAKRGGHLLQSRKGKLPDWNSTEDIWRDEVFDLISSIFSRVCPYYPSSADLATSVNNVVKGYLLNSPGGTGHELLDHGGRLYGTGGGELYVNETYNATKWEVTPTLRPKRKFWDFIIHSLRLCRGGVKALNIIDGRMPDEADQEPKLMLRKVFPNNNTYVDIELSQLYINEQADREYSLNWAIDMNWKIFATVLGACLPFFEYNMPLVYAKLYSMYTEDFLHPLRQIWMSNRDNHVFRIIFGNYYGNNVGWTRNCMESSYVNSGDPNFRPLRWLYVNQFSELNFFTNGPMAGKSGVFFD